MDANVERASGENAQTCTQEIVVVAFSRLVNQIITRSPNITVFMASSLLKLLLNCSLTALSSINRPYDSRSLWNLPKCCLFIQNVGMKCEETNADCFKRRITLNSIVEDESSSS